MKKLLLVLSFAIIFSYQNAIAIEAETQVSLTPNLDKAESKLKNIFYPLYNQIEVFRQKKAEHFAIVRDETKLKLGIDLKEDAIERLKPFLSPPSAPSPLPSYNPDESLQIKKMDNPTDYGRLILFTALASLFASIWMFYAILLLLIFVFLRTVFKAIV